ncbi:GIY-YIG nuclease family protein [Xanthomonas phaseoli]|uniref:GIY-YIG nuclease family protein n=1 Tax=Xanthomonas phaseoli TaxID=1985254 RepID=UPI001237CAF4|nr:GIY-YIG nuclease family protein [Xanthomonas phaseoli]MBO9831225.1 GIY-YIG nuclease family protein [Xanthomonas phaseoli pv. dieffenbachiae]MBO9837560.1 GIY-YIG nuclease family protein [Xanthomonas phaseoli pv. dieffenbachiae]MBO9839200.1 GIY-YIG nuclease family protein [Xanthomonas phaseoli pv. dieffenbachiae]MBO9861195.1 GIY-YIG nuclease family protein [Xanthomonas phaseoli pv. dieffenbachiae]MBO9865071.1 GIY-YIG nuclease family protein [Xanthomonas phaseoli pv. dieffenbachiae]
MPVYFVGENEVPCETIKIGVAKCIDRRIRDLQTGNFRKLNLLGWINAGDDDFPLEKRLHRRFQANCLKREWFAIEPSDVFEVLKEAGMHGFVAKNADAFQIVGYDRDAMPEYLGVWPWGDMEIEECCPFCGCLCGMDFQEASQMYHCRQCDELTDFSELDPRDEEDDMERD